MAKFVAIYRVPVATMDAWKTNTPAEEIQTQMKKMGEDMGAWMQKHAASFVGEGMPLGKTMTVSKDGVKDSRNDLNFLQIVEADSHEAACAIFSDSPHMMIPDSTIDVMAVSDMRM